MEKKEFQTIQELGFPALMERLRHYKGAERREIPEQSINSAVILKSERADSSQLIASVIWLEGVHFDLVYTPLNYLGYKLAVSAVSRLLAMGGLPILLQVDLAVPNKFSVGMIEQVWKGFDKAGKELGCSVRAGDTTPSRQLVALAAHVVGEAPVEGIILRNGSHPGDQICVTGDLGGAMAGLRVLLREKQEWEESGQDTFQPDLYEYEYVVGRQLAPAARIDFIDKLKESGVRPTGMIELGQGLLNGLQLLMNESNTGCEIFSPAVPIALETRRIADEMQEDVDRYAFYGGEDYEMLFTLKEEDVEKLRAEFDDFTVIGEIRQADSGIVINTGEERRKL